MIKDNRITAIQAGAALGLLLLSASASALDFEQRTTLHNRSVFQGIDRAEVALVGREQGPGRVAVLGTMFDKLQRGRLMDGKIEGEDDEDRRRSVRGRAWKLTANEDGTRIQFRNRAKVDENRVSGRLRRVEDRLSNPQLESLGRDFIQKHLADTVTLGSGEELVALFTEHEVESAVKNNGERAPDHVAGSVVVFGRTIDGISVVGPGSKVAIMFTAFGEPVGFDVDWPKYRRTNLKQKIHGIAAIRERAAALTAVPEDTSQVDLERFECGYVDLGSRFRGRDAKAPIQAGCAAHYLALKEVFKDGDPKPKGHEKSAYTDYVPIGVDVIADQGWRATAACAGGDTCEPRSVNAVLQTLEKAPGKAPQP